MSEDLIHSNIISNYNKFLTGNIQKFDKSFDKMQPIGDFENILNSQIAGFPDIEQFNYKNIEVVQPKESGPTTAETILGDLRNAIGDGLNSLNDKQIEAQRATEIFAAGGDIDVHEVMIAAEKASLSMQLALQMRNRMVSFYNEIKNMNF